MKKRKGCVGCPAEFDPCLWSGAGDNPTHLIVVSDRPSGLSIGQDEVFYGETGRLFRRLMAMVKKYQGGKYNEVKTYCTYAVLAGAYDPTAKHRRQCQPNLLRELSTVQGIEGREPVVIAMGITALKSLGIPAKKISKVVGRTLTMRQLTPGGMRTMKVIPTFEMRSVSAQPGFTNIVVAALLLATQLAMGDTDGKEIPLEVLTKDYIFPKTLDEVKKLVDHVIDYYDPDKGLGPDRWSIALDTETNTLYPHSVENPKTLMASVAWDDGKAGTILLDHEEVPYDPAEAWKHVERLLRCPKPKAFHNWKFDRKFLETLEGYHVNNVVWDTMLGEHYIDEDKKGHYGLKKLTTIYAPAHTGYDDKLHEILRGGMESEEGIFVVSEDQVLDAPVAPEGRDQYDWDALVEAINARREEIQKPTNRRDKVILKELKQEIDQTYKRLDLKKPKKKSKKKKEEDSGFEKIPLDIILQYAGVDADVTRMIMKSQLHRVAAANTGEEARSVMRNLYLPGSRTLGDMEFVGFKLDKDYLEKVDHAVSIMLRETEKRLKSDFDSSVNYRSPIQVVKLMTRMNFERIPGAAPSSTGKEVLERYIKHYKNEDPRKEFARALLEFRSADKAKSGFLNKLRKLSMHDGRIHTTIHLNGTTTGRTASSNPNTQNLPPYMCRIVHKDDNDKEVVKHPGFNIKKLFIPSSPDNVIVNADIRGAELRVYPAYSHDEKMIETLLAGRDVHSFTASEIYRLPYETVNTERHYDKEMKKKRDIAKRVVFGIFYGAGAYKIAEQINCTKEEAQRIINLLFTAFPALRRYIADTKAQVRSKQVVMTHFGRLRRFRLAHTSRQHFAEACREAVNFLIQSTASDLVISQLCEVSDHLPELDGQMLITVHDSMVFEMPEKNVDKLKPFLDHWITERVAEKFDWLPVPFEYDVEVGPSYGELKEMQWN